MGKKFSIKKTIIPAIITLLLVAGVIYVYEPFASGYYFEWPLVLENWPTGTAEFPNTGVFRIDPGTILPSINERDVDVFLPESRSVDDVNWTGDALYPESIEWRQADYLKIGNALNKFVWNDALDDWNLFHMSFATTCQDNPTSLTRGDFRYFKTIFERGKIKYSWRTMFVIPEYLNVAWGGDAVYPRLPWGYKKIDLSRLKVTAEDAIGIAEENGGREARLRIQNQCNIVLLLMPQRFDGWHVSLGQDFDMYINEYTGEIIK
ncbi:MAG: hypothetical protein L0287_13475 [Anaerolineae bacterium]|nr:hypothetical protein [Anaerolineae bacterium]